MNTGNKTTSTSTSTHLSSIHIVSISLIFLPLFVIAFERCKMIQLPSSVVLHMPHPPTGPSNKSKNKIMLHRMNVSFISLKKTPRYNQPIRIQRIQKIYCNNVIILKYKEPGFKIFSHPQHSVKWNHNLKKLHGCQTVS